MTDSKAYETGIASEYLVLSILFRLGANAFLSMGNKKAVDILISKSDGTFYEIDVKSVSGYSSIPVNNIKEKANRFIIFVVYRNKFRNIDSLPNFYIVPSKIVIDRCDHFKEQMRIMPKKHILEYKDRWDLIMENMDQII